MPGERTDGHRYAAEAVSRGAASLLCAHVLDLDVTQVVVPADGVRPAMATVAAAFWGHPARALRTVGVTGTNGKTTVTQLVGSVLQAAGWTTEVIGTLGGTRTTPEAPDLQSYLAEAVGEGKRAVVMEVSSHTLTQHRVDAIEFDVVAFTNLSRDHLDHHRTMEAYFEAKASLFAPGRYRHAVVFADDPWGARLLGRLDPATTTAVRRAEAGPVSSTLGSSRFTWRGRTVDLPLSGRSTWTTPWWRPRCHRPGHRRGPRGGRARTPPRWCPAGWRSWVPATRSPWWWTTPTPRRGSARPCRGRAGAGRSRPGGVPVRLRRRPRPRASGRKWGRWPPRWPMSWC